MKRRTFVKTLVGTVCATALPRTGLAQSNGDFIDLWQTRIRAILSRGALPIIDMEATYVADTNVERMIAFMDRLNVAQIAFAPANAPNSQPALDLHRRYPAYFIPTTNSGEFARWWTDPVAFIDMLGNEVRSGRYFLMGEHEFRHYPSPEQVEAKRTNRDISIPIDGPAGEALFKLSSDSGLSFQIHYEAEDLLLPALEAMLARHPQAKVIWCHLGMVRYPERAATYGPAYVRGLIERFDGLYFDLAVPAPQNIYRPSGARDSTLYRNGKLDPAWRDVIEAHPERFLAASDYRLPIENRYDNNIERLRSLILADLSDRARHLAAYGNAWRLITGKAWQN